MTEFPYVDIIIDGRRITFPSNEQRPLVVDGRTLVPVRLVFEAMGFTVEWDGATQTATFTGEEYSIVIRIGSFVFTMNGEAVPLLGGEGGAPVLAQIIGGRTMVPFRALLESIGCEVGWNEAARSVIVRTPGASRSGKVGYLAFGANGIADSPSGGFFALYSPPTLDSSQERNNIGELYDSFGVTPFGALQAFGGGGSVLNRNGISNFGGQTLIPANGTLVHNGIERYCVALGPRLQNPNFTVPLCPMEMAYGTCVDIAIPLNGVTYYIPAIIVDVKAHTSPTGVIQTYVHINAPGSQPERNAPSGNIVEWYTLPSHEENNRSTGLATFNRSANIIIYRNEVLL